jgi:predicted permease
MTGGADRPSRLARLLARIVPARQRHEVIGDLSEEYLMVRRRAGRLQSAVWLARAMLSLAAAWVVRGAARSWRARSWLVRDVRQALRTLRRQPLAALGAAAMLAVGLMAVMITSALTTTLLSRPVSAAHGHMLKRVGALDAAGRTVTRFSAAEADHLTARLEGAARVTSVALEPVLVRAGPLRMQTLGEAVGAGYFDLMGIRVRDGRPLLDVDQREGAAPAAVISAVLSRHLFGSSPAAVGAAVDLNGHPFTIVGVAAAGVTSSFLGGSVDAWLPRSQGDALLSRGWRTDPAQRVFSMFALPSGADDLLMERLSAAAGDLARLYPDPWRERRALVLPGTALLGSQRRAAEILSRILAAFAALILAVAAINVGGVLLARAEVERRSAAIHIAIGAGVGSPVRRRLVEGVMTGLLGSGLAVVLYGWARTRIAEVALLPTLTLRLDLPLDAGVVLAAVSAGAAAGLLLAIGPAIWTARIDLVANLRNDGRATGDRRVARVRRGLVAAQVALSLVLLVGAALFGRSLRALAVADIGLPRDRVVAMDFDIEPSMVTAGGAGALAREALQRAAALPGVQAAAMSNRAPIDSSTPAQEVRAVGGDAGRLTATFNLATAEYFDVTGVPILSGRAFADHEDSRSDITIVNESLARRLWGAADPLGRGLVLADQNRTVRVVGVARDSRYRSIAESNQPHFYLPTEPRFGLAMLLRTGGDARQTLRMAQDAFDAMGPGVVGFFPRTMTDHLAIDLLPTRVAAAAAAWLGGFALLLSAVGLYGLVSWFVELRRREIGVRMALGADRRDIRRLVLGQALRTAAPGLVIGAALALAGAGAARTALFGVGAFDPASLAAGTAVLLAIVVTAGWAPARRAARTDPAITLRS